MEDFTSWAEKNKVLWARVYDEVIMPGFEAEWKKRDETHREELKRKQDDRHILSDYTNDLIIKNKRLTAEIEALKQQSVNAIQGIVSPRQTPSTTGLNLDNEHHDLAQRYEDLNKKYHDLSQKIKYLERKNQAVMQKNKDMKDSVRAWQEYADRHTGRYKSKNDTKSHADRATISAIPQLEEGRPQMPSSPASFTTNHIEPSAALPLVDAASPGHPDHNADISTNDDRSRQHTPNIGPSSTGSVTPRRTGLIGTSNEMMKTDNVPSSNRTARESNDETPIGRKQILGARSAVPSSSQTTVDENHRSNSDHSLAGISAVEEDDIPQFVSERSLKRKRGAQSRIAVYADNSSDGTPVKPFRVKEEQYSSPPGAQSLFRRDTIDLDDVALNTLQTPRHPRWKSSMHSAATGTSRHCRSNSAPFSQVIGTDNTQAASTGHSLHPSAGKIAQYPLTAADARALSEPSASIDVVDVVLLPINANSVIMEPIERPNKHIRQSVLRGHDQYGIFAESGEKPPPMNENATRLTPNAVRAKLNRKHISTKPDTPTSHIAIPTTTKIKVEQGPTPPKGSSRTKGMPAVITNQHNHQAKTRLAADDQSSSDSRPRWTLSTPDTRPNVRKAPLSPPKKRQLLRKKPVTELSLGDFKPNPVYNQGYSFAFSETVRKRGDRMCLPGCTNPQCCGSTFRTLAEAQGPLTSSQEAALLEDYLGEAYDNMSLTQMAVDERDELVLQARTRKLAKETGKHRQAYEGRRTPPGFWRVDFPSTQEQQEDRERAKELEKQQIKERWLEAQRRGGQWIFRDE